MGPEYPIKFTREQAERQADLVRTFWQMRGYGIHVWVEPISQTYSNDFAVRSRLRLVASPGALEKRSS